MVLTSDSGSKYPTISFPLFFIAVVASLVHFLKFISSLLIFRRSVSKKATNSYATALLFNPNFNFFGIFSRYIQRNKVQNNDHNDVLLLTMSMVGCIRAESQ